jgi:hypothetical protein
MSIIIDISTTQSQTYNQLETLKHYQQQKLKQYIVPIHDQYWKNNVLYWKYTYTDSVRTVVYKDLRYNVLSLTHLELKNIARMLGVENYNKMKRVDIIKIIKPLIIFEDIKMLKELENFVKDFDVNFDYYMNNIT